MAKAIRSLGLDPYVINVQDEYVLKSTLYAYLRYPIPVLMFEGITDISDPTNHRHLDWHAIAITGFSLGIPNPVPSNNFLLRASRIDKIYAHDDQLGPFSRMVFDGNQVTIDGKAENSLSTSWRLSGTLGKVRAVPKHFLIPLYHKIRIPFPDIHDAVLLFDRLIAAPLKQANIPAVKDPLEWDIYLTSVNDLKASVFKAQLLILNSRKILLLEELPRFIWVATAMCQGKPALTLLFDATDVQQGRFFLCAVEYDSTFAQVLRAFSKPMATQLANVQPHVWRIFAWFANSP